MKYALLILEDPTGESLYKLTLRNCVNQVIKATEENQAIQVLNEGALLFPLEHGLYALGLCIMEAKSRKIPFRTLFFDQEPSWVITPYSLNAQIVEKQLKLMKWPTIITSISTLIAALAGAYLAYALTQIQIP